MPAPNSAAPRIVNEAGYVAVWSPGHPRAVAGRVLEHLLVAEAALGRPLASKHPVHHVDDNKQNNAGANLVICESQAYHVLLHTRRRALRESGHADWLRCHICFRLDDPKNLKHRVRKSTGYDVHYHNQCNLDKSRERAAKKRGYGPTRVERAAASATCPHGHLWTPENTYYPPGSKTRECRTCIRERVEAYRRKKRSCR